MYKNILKDQIRDAMYDINAGTGFAQSYTRDERVAHLEYAATMLNEITESVTFNLGQLTPDSWFLKDFKKYVDDPEQDDICQAAYARKLFDPQLHLKPPFPSVLLEYWYTVDDLFALSPSNMPAHAQEVQEFRELVNKANVKSVVNFVYATVLGEALMLRPFSNLVYSQDPVFKHPSKIATPHHPCVIILSQVSKTTNLALVSIPNGLKGWWNRQNQAGILDIDATACVIFMKFLELLRCRNVSFEEVISKPLSKKQQRRYDKEKRSHPEASYRKLTMTLPKANKSATAKTPKCRIGESVPIDVRAGHFKTFTKERPLFGKVVGTFWWQPILKTKADVEYTIDHQNI